MIEGVREPANAAGLIEPELFDAGVRDLHRTSHADGVFCYTLFKATGKKRQNAGLRLSRPVESRPPTPVEN